jgi:hypothetical protein
MPQPAFNSEFFAIVIDGDCVSPVCLKLYGVSAGRLGRIDDTQCSRDILVVIPRHLGDDVGGVAWPDQSTTNIYFLSHLYSLFIKSGRRSSLI